MFDSHRNKCRYSDVIKINKLGNVRINVILRCVRAAIVVLGKAVLHIVSVSL
jgi:hypothetical protein